MRGNKIKEISDRLISLAKELQKKRKESSLIGKQPYIKFGLTCFSALIPPLIIEDLIIKCLIDLFDDKYVGLLGMLVFVVAIMATFIGNYFFFQFICNRAYSAGVDLSVFKKALFLSTAGTGFISFFMVFFEVIGMPTIINNIIKIIFSAFIYCLLFISTYLLYRDLKGNY